MRHLSELMQSDNLKNYYSAYSYVVKNDPDFVIYPGLIDLLNADSLASTSARPAEARKLHRLPKICNERDSQYTALYALYNTKLVLYANYANKRFLTRLMQ